jgi:AraC-like DNA-binding protein
VSDNLHLCLNQVELAPGAEWTVAHPGWRLVLIARGVGYWLEGRITQETGPGQGLAISPLSHGLFRASQINSVNLVWFGVIPSFLAGVLTLQECHHLEKVVPYSKPVVEHLGVGHPVSDQFSVLAQVAAPACELGKDFLTRCEMLRLVALVFAQDVPLVDDLAAESTASANSRFMSIIGRIPEATLLQRSPVELARQCGCSLRHLNRLFRRHFGASIRAKQTELRLEQARKLLRDTDAKVAHVAWESGYRHLGLFNALFKKHFGMTPSEWRQQSGITSPAKSKENFRLLGFVIGLFLGLELLGTTGPADIVVWPPPEEPAVTASSEISIQVQLSFTKLT